MRILIIKLGSIGDIVHALPALSFLRDVAPGSHISWVVETRSAEILRDNPLIDDLIEIDTHELRGLKALDGLIASGSAQLRRLRSYGYDIALDMQGLIKSALVARLSGAPRRYGFEKRALRESSARMFYTHTVPVGHRRHVIMKNMALAGAALFESISAARAPGTGPFPASGGGVVASGLRFPIATDLEHMAEADGIVAEAASAEIAVLNPGGGWVTKLWPAENFGKLADRLWQERGLAPVIVTGPKEAWLAERAVAASRSRLARPHLRRRAGGRRQPFRQTDSRPARPEGVVRTAQTRSAVRRRRYGAHSYRRSGRYAPRRAFRPDRMVAKRQPAPARHLRRTD